MDERSTWLVRITGLRNSPLSRQQTVAAFAALLQIPLEEAGSRVAGLPFTVRSGLAAHEAAKYLKVLERIGFECLVVGSEVQPAS